jgi:two-component system, NtrC family, sensor kinase
LLNHLYKNGCTVIRKSHLCALGICIVFSIALQTPAICQTSSYRLADIPEEGISSEMGTLLRKAKSSLADRPGDAAKAAAGALQKSRSVSNPLASALAYEILGEARVQLRNPTGAIAAFRNAVKEARRISAKAVQVRCIAKEATVYFDRKSFDTVRTIINSALPLLPLRDKHVEGSLFFISARTYFYTFNYATASREYSRASAAFQIAHSEAEEAKSLKGEANCNNNLGEYQPALLLYNQALEISTRLKDVREQIGILSNIAGVYISLSRYPEAIQAYQNAIAMAKKHGDKRGLAICSQGLGTVYQKLADYERAIAIFIETLPIADELGYESLEAYLYQNLGGSFSLVGEFDRSMEYYSKELQIHERLGDENAMLYTHYNIAQLHLSLKDTVSAELSFARSLELSEKLQATDGIVLNLSELSKRQLHAGKHKDALATARKARTIIEPTGAISRLSAVYIILAQVFQAMQSPDSSVVYYRKAFEIGRQTKTVLEWTLAANGLAEVFASMKKYDSAYVYKTLFSKGQDNIFTESKYRQSIELEAKYQTEQKENEIELLTRNGELRESNLQQNRTITTAIAGGLLLTLIAAVIAFIAYRGQKTTLRKLRTTQDQLVIQEKLASLGQITAGIAHEIQNPLNFVNNFSELNNELAVEAIELLAKPGQLGEGRSEELSFLVETMRDNDKKVSEHGQRASSIVNQMLQQSRLESGEPEKLDINTIIADVTQLAYFGQQVIVDGVDIPVDSHVSEQPLIVLASPNDLSRVFVNLLNNAFDAIGDRSKLEQTFEPSLSIITRKNGNYAEVLIRDNGSGIPDAIKEKIFDPFYTTKSPGKGTGLGLSLCYDIINQKYQGQISVDSQINEFTEFTISLPLKA